MTYRAVVRHVRYWRGAIHRWSTVYQFVGTPTSAISLSDAQAVYAADSAMCWAGESDDNGVYECSIYNQASGGVPIVSYTVGNWEEPSTWVPATGTAWSRGQAPTAEPAEQALLVEWKAGTSKSGKPVLLRKWYHAVPQSLSGAGSPDVGAADLSSLAQGAQALSTCLNGKSLMLGSASGRLAGSPTVVAYYGAHQMSRGRRRKTSAAQSQSQFQQILTELDALGAAAAASG